MQITTFYGLILLPTCWENIGSTVKSSGITAAAAAAVARANAGSPMLFWHTPSQVPISVLLNKYSHMLPKIVQITTLTHRGAVSRATVANTASPFLIEEMR